MVQTNGYRTFGTVERNKQAFYASPDEAAFRPAAMRAMTPHGVPSSSSPYPPYHHHYPGQEQVPMYYGHPPASLPFYHHTPYLRSPHYFPRVDSSYSYPPAVPHSELNYYHHYPPNINYDAAVVPVRGVGKRERHEEKDCPTSSTKEHRSPKRLCRRIATPPPPQKRRQQQRESTESLMTAATSMRQAATPPKTAIPNDSPEPAPTTTQTPETPLAVAPLHWSATVPDLPTPAAGAGAISISSFRQKFATFCALDPELHAAADTLRALRVKEGVVLHSSSS